MASRRQQKLARVIRESVSSTIRNRLSDPRITGLVSITDVDISPDIKNATVYLSILAPEDKQNRQTFEAICHAIGPIQFQLGRDLTGKYCPRLRFELDTKMKKTIETLRLIEQAQSEYSVHPLQGTPEETDEIEEDDDGAEL